MPDRSHESANRGMDFSASRAQQRGPNRKSIGWLFWFGSLLGIAAVLSALWFPRILDQRRQPIYEGRRIGYWFDELCLGSVPFNPADSARVGRMTAAADVFSKADTNAIPFLVKQLLARHSNVRETLVTRGRSIPLISGAFNRAVPPSHRRLFAAFALDRMGPKAETCIAPLLQALSDETKDAPKKQIVSALASVMGMPSQANYHPRTWPDYEEAALMRIRERFPEAIPAK